MSSPSQAILEGILSLLKERNLTTSALAQSCGIPKRELKRILSGKSPLTVDQLSQIGSALQIEDQDLQHFLGVKPKIDTESFESDAVIQTVEDEEEDWTPNSIGNHALQIFRTGFALGCDMFFVARSELLINCGIPETILKQYGDRLPIRLDSQFFLHYRPKYFDDGLEIRLSFDAVYTCFFPWHAFEQITFYVDEDEPSEESEEEVSPNSHLKIVD